MGIRNLFVLAAIALVHLATQAPGQVLLGSGAAPESVIEGPVAEVFGARLIVASERGRILVDPVGRDEALPVVPGEQITATGSLSDQTLAASRITRSDGTILFQAVPQTSPATPATDGRAILQALAALQLKPAGPPVRKKHHTEILAVMADGRTVYVSFDRFGRIDEIEDATYNKAAIDAGRGLTEADYREIAKKAGFLPLDDFEVKKRHIELLTRNRAGELVELHIDRSGYIYKQVWVR
ncbi:hypothetical protein [Pseudorhodoplanes sp.]|uniref:hypothetical protein n=1 Tax=Pseudorhodoplanes sp. TaxID=1934341 RepID=UPI00391D76D3